MVRVLVLTAALGAAVAILVGLALPPARLIPPASVDDGSVGGAFHVHTNRSDGRSSPEEIAAIAARAGLRFVVFTDHGDGTRQPDPPSYRSGVLCLDGVEVSTTRGHVLALGLPTSPFPLGGEPRDVLEDIHRFGGFGVAAHPDSPKPELQWGDWTAPIDGLEIVNLDTAWRVSVASAGWDAKKRLLRALLSYPFRPSEAIAGLLTDRPALVEQWRGLSDTRVVALVGGGDVHARLALAGDNEPRTSAGTLALPSYEAVFRTMSLRIKPTHTLSGDAADDARLVLDAIRRGRGYVALDAVMEQPSLSFTATNRAGTAIESETLEVNGPLTVNVKTNAPPTFTTTIWRDGEILVSEPSAPQLIRVDTERPGVYRVDVRATDRHSATPWITSNPVYVRRPAMVPVPQARPAGRRRRSLFDARTAADWRTEAAADSVVAFDVGSTTASNRELRVRWGLPRGKGDHQYAAVVTDIPEGLSAFDRIAFSARAERPMRLSVQLRIAVAPGRIHRWRRSVYVDKATTPHTVFFDDFVLADPRAPVALDLAQVHSVMFAVDTTNAAPGSSGRLWLNDVSLQGR